MIPNNYFAPEPLDRLLVFGAGGFGREVAWLARQIYGSGLHIEFVVNQPPADGSVDDITVNLLSEIGPLPGDRVVVAVGDPIARRRLAAECSMRGFRPGTLVHPRLEASSLVTIGAGTVICAGNVLTTNVALGEGVHVNLGCTVGHDVTIGSYTSLSPGVHISGHVDIGESVFIGTGAIILPGKLGERLTLGDGAVIAAGACVTRPVPPGAMVAGVPAVRKK